MSKVRWGVIGCANFARTRAIPAMAQAPNVELAAVASRSLDKAEEFRSEFGFDRAYGSYEELIADPEIDAIYNPLPNGLHGEWVIRAAEAGKHTLCEKPFTATAEEARTVAEAVEASGVKVMEAFMWRFHPQHALASRAIEDGEIGDVHLVRCAFTFAIDRKPNIRLAKDLAGGAVMDVGCYTISGARFYFSGEPTSVYAQGTLDPEYGVDMSMAAILEFPNGRALLDCGFHLPFRADVEIVGEKGSIQIPKSWLPDAEASIIINGERHLLPAVNQYVLEFTHFSNCVLNDEPTRYGPDDAVKQMQVVDAVYASMRTGEAQRLG